MGSSNGVTGAQSAARPLRILDGFLDASSDRRDSTSSAESVWIHAVSGDLELPLEGSTRIIPEGKAIAFRTGLEPSVIPQEAISCGLRQGEY